MRRGRGGNQSCSVRAYGLQKRSLAFPGRFSPCLLLGETTCEGVYEVVVIDEVWCGRRSEKRVPSGRRGRGRFELESGCKRGFRAEIETMLTVSIFFSIRNYRCRGHLCCEGAAKGSGSG